MHSKHETVMFAGRGQPAPTMGPERAPLGRLRGPPGTPTSVRDDTGGFCGLEGRPSQEPVDEEPLTASYPEANHCCKVGRSHQTAASPAPTWAWSGSSSLPEEESQGQVAD